MNAAEAINTFGGTIVDDDGQRRPSTAPRPRRACRCSPTHYKNGDIPKRGHHLPGGAGPAGVRGRQAAVPAQLALRLQPGQDRRRLEGQGQVRRRAAARRRAAPAPPASVVTARRISVYSKHKAHRARLPEVPRARTTSRSSSWSRARWPRSSGRSTTTRRCRRSYPYLPTLQTSIQNAVPRPVTPFYPAVTKAIQDNSYAAHQGREDGRPGAEGHAGRHPVRLAAADPASTSRRAGVTTAARTPGPAGFTRSSASAGDRTMSAPS